MSESRLKACATCGGYSPADARACLGCDGTEFVERDATDVETPMAVYGAPPFDDDEPDGAVVPADGTPLQGDSPVFRSAALDDERASWWARLKRLVRLH